MIDSNRRPEDLTPEELYRKRLRVLIALLLLLVVLSECTFLYTTYAMIVLITGIPWLVFPGIGIWWNDALPGVWTGVRHGWDLEASPRRIQQMSFFSRPKAPSN